MAAIQIKFDGDGAQTSSDRAESILAKFYAAGLPRLAKRVAIYADFRLSDEKDALVFEWASKDMTVEVCVGRADEPTYSVYISQLDTGNSVDLRLSPNDGLPSDVLNLISQFK
jgi:hypothetical protein